MAMTIHETHKKIKLHESEIVINEFKFDKYTVEVKGSHPGGKGGDFWQGYTKDDAEQVQFQIIENQKVVNKNRCGLKDNMRNDEEERVGKLMQSEFANIESLEIQELRRLWQKPNKVIDVCKCGNIMFSHNIDLEYYDCKKKEFNHTESYEIWYNRHVKLVKERSGPL